jgi:hypothetical protein
MPTRGSVVKRTSAFTWIAGALIALAAFGCNRGERPAPPPRAPQQPAQDKKERDEAAVARMCKEWVAKSLRDPTFEAAYTFKRTPEFEQVQVKVRSRNANKTFECRVRRKDGKLAILVAKEVR